MMAKLSFQTLTLLLLLSLSLEAQIATKTGTIYGRVLNEQAEPLVGVDIALESDVILTQVATTGTFGSFRFANLPPAVYAVTVTMQGFSQVRQEDVRITTGGNVELQIVMKSSFAEQITVMAESTIVDSKKTGIDSIYTGEYLEQIPSGRDPWFIINMTIGVDSERFNTSSESGQHAFFFARGGKHQNNVWNYDGVNHTDGRRRGNSPTFYDFDAFEEIQISTAGNDASIQTGGVAVNIVTERGGNQWKGEASLYFLNDALESTNTPDELSDTPRSNRTSENMDYGFNLGGPIIGDKLFVWGGYRKSQINLINVANLPDKTELTDYNLKFNFNWNAANESQFALFKGLRDKSGFALIGAAVQAPETLWEVKNTPLQGIWTAQHTWIPSDDLLMTARYGYIGEGATFFPAGGRDVPMIYLSAIPRWESTFFVYGPDEQPAHDINIDADFFKEDLLGGDHELRFGFEYKLTNLSLFSSYGNGVQYTDLYQTQVGGPLIYGYIYAQHNVNGRSNTTRASLYVTETYRKDRLTLNLGFRFDHQTGINKPASIPAVLGFEQFLPGFDYAGGDPGISFNNFSPRLGATFDVTGNGKTLIRGNFARYYEPFNPFFVQYLNPTFAYFGAGFIYSNRNGDRIITPDEIIGDPNYYGGRNPGPFDLDKYLAARKYDPNLSTSWGNEYLFGVEQELTRDLTVAATYVGRKYGDLTEFVPFGISTTDFVPAGVFHATTRLADFNVPYFVLRFRHDGARFLANIKDYNQTYQGLDLTVRKRMSHNFTFSGGLAIQRQKGHYNAGDSLAATIGNNTYAFDPTNLPFVQDQTYAYSGRFIKRDIYNFSEWNIKLSGYYQFPWNIAAGAYLRYQQGYPYILFGGVREPTLTAVYGPGPHRFLVEPVGSRRFDNLLTLDVKIEKGFDVAEYGRVTAIVDIFNVTNSNTVLSRVPRVEVVDFNTILEVLSPRAFRLGVRYNF